MVMDFNGRVLYVVRNFIEYGRYGRDESKAARIIHKHHPEKSLSACQDEFSKYVKAYADAVSFVNDNTERYWAFKKDPPKGRWDKSKEEIRFIQEHPDVPDDILLWMIWFIFDWRHVR